jgi:hypothetical protein
MYLLYFPAWLAVIIARYPAAVIAVLCFSSPDRLSLTRWHWLETIDNDLSGDSGWKAEHIGVADPLNSWSRIKWLWRNGGSRFNYYTIGVSYSNRPSWAFWHSKQIPLFAGRFLDARFGWTDYALQGRCKYVFTIRIKTKP